MLALDSPSAQLHTYTHPTVSRAVHVALVGWRGTTSPPLPPPPGRLAGACDTFDPPTTSPTRPVTSAHVRSRCPKRAASRRCRPSHHFSFTSQPSRARALRHVCDISSDFWRPCRTVAPSVQPPVRPSTPAAPSAHLCARPTRSGTPAQADASSSTVLAFRA